MKTSPSNKQLRQWSNLQILDKLRDVCLKYPDVRFYQILNILDLSDKSFNEESLVTLEELTKKLCQLSKLVNE